ncbi:MAG: cyanophycin synthetase [Gracilibacteraceae bacterium]|jgi:cyanophycin synthetase|nr:cyanophycin synthetase [Gracilibacteraceae bacterium]
MQLKHLTIIEGPNIYSHGSIARATVDISAWGQEEDQVRIPFVRRLLLCLPGLAEHRCSLGRPGGFVERLRQGTLAGHILEHVALELLVLAGEDVGFGKTRAVDDGRRLFDVVIGYECRETALLALSEGCALLNRLKGNEDVGWEMCDQWYVRQIVRRIEAAGTRCAPGPSTGQVLAWCRRLRVPVRLYHDSLMRLGYGCHSRWMRASLGGRDSCIAVEVAQDKVLTRKIIGEAGLPVPLGKVIRSEREARDFVREMGRPVVIKPCTGNQGRGVFVNLCDENQAAGAFRLAVAGREDGCALAEEHVEGDSFRLLVIDGVVAAAARKIPAKVTGDGRSTLARLIEVCNREPARGDGHDKMLTRLRLCEAEIFDLACRGWTPDMVPEKGCEVVVRSGANLSTGGTAEDVTPLVHEGYRRMAVDAALCVGLSVAGVDLVTPDISRFEDDRAKILEVNAAPGLRMHLPSDLGRRLVGSLFPDGQGRIPVVAVTGSNGKSTVARMVAQGLALVGRVVGLTCSDGVYIDGEMVRGGDRTGPESARCVLSHPRVEAAVLETARGGILRGGLGYDWADVAVVTNVTGDHLGEYGVKTMADLLKVKSLVVERVPQSGYVVLNADDEGAFSLAEHAKAPVIFFSRHPGNGRLEKHLSVNGKAVLLLDNKIILVQGSSLEVLCHLRETALGRSAIQGLGIPEHRTSNLEQTNMPGYLVENMLAAVGAVWALGQSSGDIMGMLKGFGNADNPGRWEVYKLAVDGRGRPLQVILDYAHNPAALRAVAEALRVRPGGGRRQGQTDGTGKIIGCIGMPGNRRDEDILDFGRIAGEIFDSVYIKEDEDRRGRESGEVSDLMKRGVSGTGNNRIQIVASETEALRSALLEARASGGENSTVLVCYEHLERVRECLRDYKVL